MWPIVESYGAHPIIVTDRNLAGLPAVQTLLRQSGGAPVFKEVQPNPTVQNVDALADRIRANRCDAVVAIGGGSPMDCAKAASLLVRSSAASIRLFHSGGEEPRPGHLPVIAVPTTAGTGSEVTPFAVLDDPEKNLKAPLATSSFYPVHAVVDPSLTASLPKKVTAATGLDALCHAIEGYWSRNHQPICDLMAMEAVRLVFANLPRLFEVPDDREARSAMSYAALLAGAAFQLPKNAMVHACSFPLSNRFHLTHGAACALTLEFAMRHNEPHMGRRMSALVQSSGCRTLEEMTATVGELKRLGGLPCTLAEAGIPREAVESLVEESFHPLMNNNPAPVTENDLRRMFGAL